LNYLTLTVSDVEV